MTDSTRAHEPADPSVQTILIVDDDEGIGEFLVTALTMEANYRALLMPNAALALEAVKTLIPNLFILDYQLPGINGLALADLLHAIDTLKYIPVLLMSANPPKQELEQRSMTFLEKPFELDAFLQAVEHSLAG